MGWAFMTIAAGARLYPAIQTSREKIILVLDVEKVELKSKEYAGNKIQKVYFTVVLRDGRKMAAASQNLEFERIMGAIVSPITDPAQIAKIRAEIEARRRKTKRWTLFLLVIVAGLFALGLLAQSTNQPTATSAPAVASPTPALPAVVPVKAPRAPKKSKVLQ